MSETTKHDADRARALLEDPTLQKAFADVRESLVKEAERADVADADAQARLITGLQMLAAVRAAIEHYLNNGEILNFNERMKRTVR